MKENMRPVSSQVRRAVAVLALILIGCRDDIPTATELGGDIMYSAVQSVPADLPVDEYWAQVADIVPEYGGHYVSSGIINIFLTDMRVQQEVRQALLPLLRAETGADIPLYGLRFRQGKHNFRKLQDARYRIAEIVSRYPEFSSLDIDDEANKIRIGLINLSARTTIASDLSAQGVDADLYDFTNFVFAANYDSLHHFTSFMRGGRKITVKSSLDLSAAPCTYGFTGRHRETSVMYMFTNTHCTARRGTVDSDEVHQPDLTTNYVAREEIDPPFFSGTNAAGWRCPYSGGCRWADVAAFRVTSRIAEFQIEKPKATFSLEVTPFPYYQHGLSGARRATGWALTYVGHKTGLATGNITHRCVDIAHTGTRAYDTSQRTFLCQNLASYASQAATAELPSFIPLKVNS